MSADSAIVSAFILHRLNLASTVMIYSHNSPLIGDIVYDGLFSHSLKYGDRVMVSLSLLEMSSS